jgi:hypothetical protein
MKKLFFITLFLLLSTNSIAQMHHTLCGLDYEIKVSSVESDVLPSLQEAQMNWDFSKFKLSKDLTVTIEVVSIFDCFNGEKAIDFKETIRISSNDPKFNKSGGFLFKHEDMMSKCFKWRVIINSLNCIETSHWQYFSYLK